MSADRTSQNIRRSADTARRLGLPTLMRCRRGIAALEFALVSAPLTLMLFGFVSLNSLFMSLTSMQSGTLNAAMVMATGQITSFQSRAVTCSNSLSNTAAEYYACQGLPSWATFTATATENCTSPATVTVLLSVNGASAAIADIYGFFSGKTFSAQSVMMKQGTCP